MEIEGSLGFNGLKDWLLQRLSALILMGYFFFLVIYFIYNPSISYTAWKTLFALPLMRLMTLLALSSLLLHAWIGIWTVCTDYLKITSIRILFLFFFFCGLFLCFIWGIAVLWSI